MQIDQLYKSRFSLKKKHFMRWKIVSYLIIQFSTITCGIWCFNEYIIHCHPLFLMLIARISISTIHSAIIYAVVSLLLSLLHWRIVKGYSRKLDYWNLLSYSFSYIFKFFLGTLFPTFKVFILFRRPHDTHLFIDMIYIMFITAKIMKVIQGLVL